MMILCKQLYVLLQVLLVTGSIVNEASAEVQNKNQLRKLVRNSFVRNFQNGGLVRDDRTQFAVAALLPDTQWRNFRYIPSNSGGQKPIIDKQNSLSPPKASTYNNYLAARPTRRKHSETQILDRLDDLYNKYKANHGGQSPQVLLLYSWIVPCKKCTDDIVAKLTNEPFNSIPTKVVAYTTRGTTTKCTCDVKYTEEKFKNTGIDLFRVGIYPLEEELIENIIAQLILE